MVCTVRGVFCAGIIGCRVHETIEIQEPDRNQPLNI